MSYVVVFLIASFVSLIFLTLVQKVLPPVKEFLARVSLSRMNCALVFALGFAAQGAGGMALSKLMLTHLLGVEEMSLIHTAILMAMSLLACVSAVLWQVGDSQEKALPDRILSCLIMGVFAALVCRWFFPGFALFPVVGIAAAIVWYPVDLFGYPMLRSLAISDKEEA